MNLKNIGCYMVFASAVLTSAEMAVAQEPEAEAEVQSTASSEQQTTAMSTRTERFYQDCKERVARNDAATLSMLAGKTCAQMLGITEE